MLARMVASEFTSDAAIRFKLGRRATDCQAHWLTNSGVNQITRQDLASPQAWRLPDLRCSPTPQVHCAKRWSPLACPCPAAVQQWNQPFPEHPTSPGIATCQPWANPLSRTNHSYLPCTNPSVVQLGATARARAGQSPDGPSLALGVCPSGVPLPSPGLRANIMPLLCHETHLS
ncbi:hypothetical protein PCASD_26567 [Puccinia coronata f. sp. avenae]|uniref:Uncharacterized protein n=1 Tax=Puccinia coronata f. sp. avenae TaxID=200324 RepID=A0A2N5TJM5_9BASI|nr:hypothetical protein PCASD_26567 [Puccinia coronata f. sp. avenae]